jgi:diguanylate cyclase (GGDEF)-like protein
MQIRMLDDPVHVPRTGDAPASASGGEARRVERLLVRLRPHEERRLTDRERRTELVAAAGCLLASVALLIALPPSRPFPALLGLALVAAYALTSRVRLFLGGGSAVLTQLVLVPMLFWLPVASVPLLVAAALAADAGLDVLRLRAHPERVLTATADAWYAVGPAVVLALAGPPAAGAEPWALIAAALAAQFTTDASVSIARERIGRGIPAALQVRVMLTAFAIDACLTPLAVLCTTATASHPVHLLALLPLVGLLGALAADRRARIAEAVARVDELAEERRRLDLAIRRIGEVSASRLDRRRLLHLSLGTAVEAVGASGGRATAGGASVECEPSHIPAALAPVVTAAEDAARHGEGVRLVKSAAGSAMAYGLRTAPDARTADVLVVARGDGTFDPDQQALFGHLASQAAVAMENVDLHERIAREATTDELTGLANHRRFQDVLRSELDRSRRSGRPVGLVMLDIDGFKAFNDRHGHLQGDAVLRTVATAVRETCRAGDVAARYGGEELAVVAPGTDADGAWVLGEAIRRAVEEARVASPGGPALRVTTSVGTAAAADGADAEALVAAADTALYAAKRSGKNRTVRASLPARRPSPRQGGGPEPGGRFAGGRSRRGEGARRP